MRAVYKHLHPDLKRLLRDVGIRPSRKACFQNCQRILLAAEHTPMLDRLAYHEGWVECSAGVPIKHAWLTLDNSIQDPTLANRQPEHYLFSKTYPVAQIRESISTSGLWKPIDERALDDFMFGPALKLLEEVTDPPLYYDRQGQPCSANCWARLYQDRFLCDDYNVGPRHYRVATIFTGLDPDLRDPPRIFETTVFAVAKPYESVETHGWTNESAALAGHASILQRLNQDS